MRDDDLVDAVGVVHRSVHCNLQTDEDQGTQPKHLTEFINIFYILSAVF